MKSSSCVKFPRTVAENSQKTRKCLADKSARKILLSLLSFKEILVYLICDCHLNHTRNPPTVEILFSEPLPPNGKFSSVENSYMEKILPQKILSHPQKNYPGSSDPAENIPGRYPCVKLSRQGENKAKKICIGIMANSPRVKFSWKVHPRKLPSHGKFAPVKNDPPPKKNVCIDHNNNTICKQFDKFHNL